MNKIVVDSNIVFSAILNTQTKIGQLILDGSRYFEYYSTGLLKREILNHQEKILGVSGYSFEYFMEIFELITGKIKFIDEAVLSNEELDKASELVKGIDENDMLFVALNRHLNGELWIGDKKLIAGLELKGYNRTLSTDDLYSRYIQNQLIRTNK